MAGDYRFIDKDPAIDVVRLGIERSPLTLYEVSNETYRRGQGVAVGTIQQWLYGKTRRPQRASLAIVMEVLGIDMRFHWQETGERITLPNKFRAMPRSWLKQSWKERRMRRKAKAL